VTTLHVDLGRQWRGGQHQVFLLLQGLRARGHAAELVALGGAPLAARAAAEGFTVHEVAPSLARPRAALRLSALLGRSRYDVVHAHEAHGLTSAWLAGAHRRAALVAARHVAYPLNSPGRYRAAQRVAAESEFIAQTVVASGLPREHVTVIYSGAEVPPLASREERREARRSFDVPDDAPLLGCTSYLLPEKGHDKLIRALPAVRAQFPKVRLLLAGPGPCEAELEELARSLRVEPAVYFWGFVEDVQRVYRALDVFVFPSLEEPLGTSLLAAMGHALPVVAVASGGVPEVVVDKETGLLAPAADPEWLASALIDLLREPARAAQMGAAGRRRVLECFTADHMVENTLRLYRELAGGAAA
jgi:glycosyltransferase involved in cell wall biosynthesis